MWFDENNLFRPKQNTSLCVPCYPTESMELLSRLLQRSPLSRLTKLIIFQVVDLQQEHQREMEGLLENIREMTRELKLQMLTIDTFIPPEYQVSLKLHVVLLSAQSSLAIFSSVMTSTTNGCMHKY